MTLLDRFIKTGSIVILITSAVLMAIWSEPGQHKVPEQKTLLHLPAKTVYKTILRSDSATDLIGFELHEDGEYNDGERKCPTFNAVVRGLDPKADNYKAMCRDIVADIITNYGDKEVHVNIYDSAEAYQLAMTAGQYGILSSNEERYANEHRVATYTYSKDYYDENFYLYFYPDAGNNLQENESFTVTRVM